jgi:GST-like protein
MIDVYTANTPNGIKVPIALEELAVRYRVIRVDLGAQEQKRPDFLRLNPNGRIPAIVDSDGPGGAPLSVFESGAILWYLAEKYPGLMPDNAVERIRALEYTFFQVGGVGPMFGQAGWFMRHSEPMPGVPIEVVSELAGHASIDTTSIYSTQELARKIRGIQTMKRRRVAQS